MNLKVNLKRIIVPIVPILFLGMTCTWIPVFACGWNLTNDPCQFEEIIGTGELTFNLNQLPKEGRLSKKPWPDTYWPTRYHGIAWRWQGDVKYRGKNWLGISNKNDKFSLSEIKEMSAQDINHLSPAEKFDLLQCNYDWKMYSDEMKRTWNSGLSKLWTGICHGWSPAAMRYQEPCDIVVKNLDGVVIPFASSDIKALLSWWEIGHSGKVCQVGGRCGVGSISMSDMEGEKNSSKNDINPGAFHVLLANMIGKRDEGFVMDRDPAKEVWNQPVEGFKVLSMKKKNYPDYSRAAKGTVQEVLVETEVIYTGELEDENYQQTPSVKPVVEKEGEAEKSFRKHVKYHYILELDGKNNILGGRWLTTDHPDFVWISEGQSMKDDPYYKGIGDLYKMSIKNKVTRH